MNRYTLFCTKEQTIKAFELGAKIKSAAMPLDIALSIDKPRVPFNKVDVLVLTPPTAEQMIGFLRSKGVKFLLSDEPDAEGCYWFIGNGEESISCGKENESKELAAIDAALEYLTNNK